MNFDSRRSASRASRRSCSSQRRSSYRSASPGEPNSVAGSSSSSAAVERERHLQKVWTVVRAQQPQPRFQRPRQRRSAAAGAAHQDRHRETRGWSRLTRVRPDQSHVGHERRMHLRFVGGRSHAKRRRAAGGGQADVEPRATEDEQGKGVRVRRCEGARVRGCEVADRREPGEGLVVAGMRCCRQQDERARAVREDRRRPSRDPIGRRAHALRRRPARPRSALRAHARPPVASRSRAR